MNALSFLSGWSAYALKKKLRVVIIYRPPYSEDHPVTALTFCSEFAYYMESVLLSKEQLVIVGDMNIHVDDASDVDVRNFLDLLESSMSEDQHIFMDILWNLLLHA